MNFGCAPCEARRLGALGIANPSATNCEQLGGRYEAAPQGPMADCVFPDGRRVDAWDLYRQSRGAEGVMGETKPDIIAGAVAFGVPLAYEYGAPKRWPRLNWWQNVGAVVGLYFLSRFAYTKLTTPKTV